MSIGHRLWKARLQLSYNNQDFEFDRSGGWYSLEILPEETNPELVQAEFSGQNQRASFCYPVRSTSYG